MLRSQKSVPKISNQERAVMEKILEELSKVEVSDLERKGTIIFTSEIQAITSPSEIGDVLLIILDPF